MPAFRFASVPWMPWVPWTSASLARAITSCTTGKRSACPWHPCGVVPKMLWTVILMTGAQWMAWAGELETVNVPAELQKNTSYSRYVCMLIQIDLLANPATASLPITVELLEPGLVQVRGTVPNQKIREYVHSNAKRISGLPVRSSLRVGRVGNDILAKITTGELKQDTDEAFAVLFPELSEKLDISVSRENVVMLTGQVPSYEQKVMLSRAVKSQPGCKAVVNLLQVPPDPSTGNVTITEDRRHQLGVDSLPSIPQAQLVDLEFEDTPNQSIVRTMTPRLPMADDAPFGNLLDRQLREDVENFLAKEPQLAAAEIEVDAHGNVVYLTGKLKSREQVRLAVDVASDVPEVRKIVARCRPISLQRNLPLRASWEKVEKPESVRTQEVSGPKRWFRRLVGGTQLGEKSPESSWRFHQTIKSHIKRRSGGRIEDLSVHKGLKSLEITGLVAGPQERTFVFEQIDNIVELRNIRYDAELRLKEF